MTTGMRTHRALAGLGVDVPVFAVSAEEIERVQIWTPDVLINLSTSTTEAI